tara:strand:- start:41 stop:736 length:696 start_codon:yes stop_codon:yes gene_type:complete
MDELTELDTSNSANSDYSVKIDGVEKEVSLEELKNGYQRQADYTRKTQELASEREKLAQGEAIVQALESDPEGAITALGNAFGVSLGNQNLQNDEELEDLDPEEVRIRRIESAIEQQDRAQRQQNMQKEITQISEEYGVEIDQQKLFSHAVKNKIPNLRAAYKDMTYDEYVKGETPVADPTDPAIEDIVQEKRDAQVIDSSVGTASGNIEKAVGAVTSIRDAYELALQENK